MSNLIVPAETETRNIAEFNHVDNPHMIDEVDRALEKGQVVQM